MAPRSNSLKSIELFSGAGGLALATHSAGFRHSGLFEWNADACETLRANAAGGAIAGLRNWSKFVAQGDIRSVDFKPYAGSDLLAGGPPCQPFSLGGKHQGMEDGRDMIPHFIRAVREVQPKAFIMENVRGLARKSFETYLDYSLLQLKHPDVVRRSSEDWTKHYKRIQKHHSSSAGNSGLGYSVRAAVLNSANYGVPQCRERLFVVGFRSDIGNGWQFPEATHSVERLIFDQNVSGDYWDAVGVAPSLPPPSITRRLARLRGSPPPTALPWRTVRQAISGLPTPFIGYEDDDSIFNHRFQSGARPYPGHTGSPIDWPAKTLKAGDHGVPGGENMIDFGDGRFRYFTVREAARIQTFPDRWRFRGVWSEAMRQLGNAVPVGLARVVADSVAAQLRGGRSS